MKPLSRFHGGVTGMTTEVAAEVAVVVVVVVVMKADILVSVLSEKSNKE